MSGPSSHHTLDQRAFENLFKAHFQYLCHFAQQYVEDMDSAQDICQKVFINLWEKRTEIDASKPLKSYLFRAVKNRCLNHIRDHKKFRSKVLDLDCGDLDLVVEEEQFPENELKDKVESALNGLPEKCRKVFEMSRFQQMKYREIAEELEVSQKTVEAHMTRAMKHLRTQLKEYLTILLLIITGLGQ